MPSVIPSVYTRGDGGPDLHVSLNRMLAKIVRQHLYRPVTLSVPFAVHIVIRVLFSVRSAVWDRKHCRLSAVKVDTFVHKIYC